MSTPVGLGSRAQRVEREKDRFHPWHRKPLDVRGTHLGLNPASPLLDSDLEDHSFPLFVQSPVLRPRDDMAVPSPLGDLTSRAPRSSASPAPLGNLSNLTSALHLALQDADTRMPSAVGGVGGDDALDFGDGAAARRHDSFSGGVSGGARPISMKGSNRERPRRESVAGSMVGAMSWGGVSVGSWIRDEYVDLMTYCVDVLMVLG